MEGPKSSTKSGCRTKVMAGCGVLVIYTLGIVSGIILMIGGIGWVVPRSEGWKSKESQEFVANHIANQLKLTDDQREVIDPLIVEGLQNRWELRREYLLESEEYMKNEVLPELSKHLTPEQRERGKKLLERWRRDNLFKIDRVPKAE